MKKFEEWLKENEEKTTTDNIKTAQKDEPLKQVVKRKRKCKEK